MDITIINTGCANLTSIQVAIKKLGYSSVITSNPSIIINSKKIFFPGVGTAAAAMKKIYDKNLIDILKKLIQPILGICLGMQIFSEFSEEGEGTKTLGVFDNCFTYLLKNKNLPLPHMGWNYIDFDSIHPLFKNIKKNSRFYFVHSYIIPVNTYTLATTKYGVSFSSVMQKNNFFGVQFHPEKSGDVGSLLLKNFLEM